MVPGRRDASPDLLARWYPTSDKKSGKALCRGINLLHRIRSTGAHCGVGGGDQFRLRVAGVTKSSNRVLRLKAGEPLSAVPGKAPCVRARCGLNHPLTFDAPAVVGRVLSWRPCPCRSGKVSPGKVLVRVIRVVVDGDGSNSFPAEETAG